MKMKTGRLIVISAPSGTGKTSVIGRLLSRHPNMLHSVSCTTRSPRGKEVDGKDYHFITPEIFKKRIQLGEFAEWAQVHNWFYGTPKAPLEKALQEGREVLLDLDVQGGMNIKKMFGPKAITIFLLPPSQKELERRLSSRGTDSSEEQQVRLDNARLEMTHKDLYDHQIFNKDLEQACQEIEKIAFSHPVM